MKENVLKEFTSFIRNNKEAREQVRQLLLEILGDNSPQTKHAPVLEEVKEFVKVNDLCIDPLKFYYHYQAKGWQGITDWQALAYKWHTQDLSKSSTVDWDKETDDWDTPTTRTNKKSYINWANEPDELR